MNQRSRERSTAGCADARGSLPVALSLVVLSKAVWAEVVSSAESMTVPGIAASAVVDAAGTVGETWIREGV